ncbi:MAG: hypothetical protein HPY90_07865 [Syntrophothermus sp.]|uniref:hypothetical protein n=1 Tax=Syntrophothermus sp. TaxID=2736299 RepID=UPI00257D154C|nr:hypothetical protein [Syntrophothermus sp.]NSW83177.1 hypothetical protein [Syntrophothermus sp.]
MSKLLAWKCRQCRTVTYVEAQDPTGRSLNLPGYCSGCGKELDRKAAEFLGWHEIQDSPRPSQ